MQQVLAEGGLRGLNNQVVASVPLIVLAALLLSQASFLLIGRRPRWTEPFIQEPHPQTDDGDVLPRRRSTFAAALALISTVCFALRLPDVINTRFAAENLPTAITWFALAAMILVHRPRTAPFAVLTVFVLQAIVDLTRLVDTMITSHGLQEGKYIVATMTTTIAFTTIGICIVLSMPLRDPDLPAKDISQPMSEPTSVLRSPEDNLSLWQFMTVSWMTPLIRVGYKRQLEDEDVWQLAYEFHHQRLHDNFRLLKGTVIRRLVKANAIDLWILTILGILELVMQFSGPLLLQQLLSSMQDITAPRKAALTYAALSFAVRVIAAQSGVFSLWYGRRCYERSRGEMITMLYEKTLNRKIGFTSDTKETSPNGESNGHATNGDIHSKLESKWWQKTWSRIAWTLKRKAETPPPKEPASMGKILNLMRNDVYEVAQRFWEFQALIQKPLSLIFSITLVVRLLGWPSLIAVLATAMAQSLNIILARIMIHYEKKRRVATDSKLQVTSQWIEAIRHLRWYGWQDAWLSQIMDARQRELNLRIVTSIWNLAIGFCNTLALDLTPVIAFFAYTVIAGKPLTVDVAFPAMQLFNMMTASLRDLPNLIIVIINAWVAVGRIEDYMAEPEREDQKTEPDIKLGVSFNKASFAWPGSNTPVLRLDVTISTGLTVVFGEVASGKSAMLQAILGELDLLGGYIFHSNGPIAYCSQTPWLQSMNIRENILFGEPYDEARYMHALRSCALVADLKEFQAGDLSHIGENGIGLSGGQRARVALARAAYSRTNMALLDDPLASLDQDTAEQIAKSLFGSEDSLFKDRTVILVTHRTDLVGHMAIRALRMEAGTITDLPLDSLSKNSYATPSTAEQSPLTQIPQRDPDAVPEKFVEDEHRARGGVKASVYWEYIKAGKILFWCILVPILAVYRICAVAEAWFLKTWGEAYTHQPRANIWVDSADVITTQSAFLDDLPPPDINIKPWLLGFFILAIAQSLAFIFSQGMMIVIVYTAGKNMFAAIMDKVAGATFRFYDVTPIGRLMNRMTSDIGVIDGNISQRFQAVAWLTISWVSAMVVIGSVTPTFLLFAVLLTVTFIGIFLRFIPTSQSLRRLEMVSLTPLMSNFGALLDGLTTVRAFRVQRRFQERVVRVVDTFQKMDHFYWSLQAWLMYRYDVLSAFSTFLLTILALYTNVSAGLTAFVLIAANKVVTSTHGLCKQYGQLQMEFVSVERVVELLHLEQEPKGGIEPPAWWPRSAGGDVVFDNVTIRYAPHMQAALDDLSLRLPGGDKTVILGRTGSGKTTLALSLLATVVPESGTIVVDGINLADVNRQVLRTRVTFLAQDPVLFPGSMRKNLDPLDEYTDDDCESVLDRVCQKQGFRLDTAIAGGGRNLSQGQRQLIGLARAVLRRSAIIILDEATASIDAETATQMQRVLQEDLKESTIITIAHRPEAMVLSDYGVVIGNGKLLRQGPAQLLHRTWDRWGGVDGISTSMD
jgi:ABC-type multidrug transport system fused ATPase/permease subunit